MMCERSVDCKRYMGFSYWLPCRMKFECGVISDALGKFAMLVYLF